VHPSGVLIGDVILAPRAYIGPCASLHGCVIRRFYAKVISVREL